MGSAQCAYYALQHQLFVHAALALVAPVDAYDRTVAHNAVLLIRFFTQFLFYFSFLADYMPFSVLCKCVFRNVSNKINL